MLANVDTPTFNYYASESSYYVGHLVGYGLIQNNQNGYAFNIESIKEYLRKQYRFEQIQLSSGQKASEISERRNSIEKSFDKLSATS